MKFYKKDIIEDNANIITTKKYMKLIDFLLEHYPKGFSKPTNIYINDLLIEVDNYDIELKDEDIIVVLESYADPVSTAVAGVKILSLIGKGLISYGIGRLINKLFPIDKNKEIDRSRSDVYNINTSQNIFKRGQPIPIIYGAVRTVPSLIANTYTRYENNEEYTYQLMLVSQGNCLITKPKLGDTSITDGSVQVIALNGEVDFLNINLAVFNATGDANYRDNTRTLKNPSNIEAKVPLSVKYEIDEDAFAIEIDYAYPNGLYKTKTDGTYNNLDGGIKVIIYDSSLAIIGTYVFSDTNNSNEFIAQSKYIYVGSITGVKYVSFQRLYAESDKPSKIDNVYIVRIKELFSPINYSSTGTNIGNVTLAWVKIKASAVTASSIGEISVLATRFDANLNPPYLYKIVEDIYSNTAYGGRLPASDIDMNVEAIRFDGAITSQRTLKDTLDLVCNSQKYSLILDNDSIEVKKDDVQNVTTALYNEGNIIKDSFNLNFLYKESNPTNYGIACYYFTKESVEENVIYPSGSLFPKRVDLLGVTDSVRALEMATYLHNKEQSARTSVSFKTDIQGMIPRYLDKIKVASNIFGGLSGEIIAVNTVTDIVTIDGFYGYPTSDGTMTIRFPNGQPVDYAFTLTATEGELQFVQASSIFLNQLFTINDFETIDMLVTNTKLVSENIVQIEAINYDETIY